MKRQIPTQAKDAPKPSDAILAKRYLELQRLRDESPQGRNKARGRGAVLRGPSGSALPGAELRVTAHPLTSSLRDRLRAVLSCGGSVIVKMDPLPSEWASQRVAVLPPMTIMHVHKRSRHPKAPTNEEKAGRNPNQNHHEERLHGQAPFIPHRL
jgi:hypothetical protein